MANVVYKEKFQGKYNGVVPSVLLKSGDISDGKNIRKVSSGGGWKPRKGAVLNNTTAAETGTAIKTLHQFTHPRNSDYHFIAQVNSKLLNATNDPPATGTTFGANLGVTVGTTPGFSAEVAEHFIYADGSGVPIIWGGDDPFPHGFVVYGSSGTVWNNYTRDVTDNRSDTEAVVLSGATDKFYVLTTEIAHGVTLDLGSAVNSNSVTLTVKAWRAGAWTSVSSLSDGSADSGATLAVDGEVSWTRSTSDEMKTINSMMGYAYEFSWSGALSGTVGIKKITTLQSASAMTNKWNGRQNFVSGCRFYDQSLTLYEESLGKISSESTAQYIDISEATTSDFIYIKTPEPATGFGFGVVVDYDNDANAQIDNIETWTGAAWTAAADIDDQTVDDAGDSSFSQTGVVYFDGSALSPKRRTFGGDNYPGFWYRVSWDAELADDTRIYLVTYATFPESLPAYDGVTNFKARAAYWGDPEYPNRLRISTQDRPDCLSGSDSCYTDAFGSADPVLVAKPFYNELIVWKKHEIWLLEGYNPATFGALKITDTVGVASPQTAKVIEIGYPAMNTVEPLTIAIWQDTDGVYVLDGRKPRKVSGPVDHYFNPEYSTCISATYINSLSAFIDPINNEYHLLLPAIELVYNYKSDEWYPPWDRKIILSCGTTLRGTDNRYYTYGGSASGFVMRLESDTSDKTTANADEPISHYLKTRSIASDQNLSTSVDFNLRRIWVEFKAQTAGTIVTTSFSNNATSGTTQSVPSAMSLINTGYSTVVPKLDISLNRIFNIAFQFALDTIDHEMEIYSLIYEMEIVGLIAT